MLTPIIMESDPLEVGSKLAIVRLNEESRIHFDIGDGLFSDWLGVSPADLQGQDLTGLEIDMHLLVDDPTEWVEECVALSPRRIIGQIERMGSQVDFLQMIESYNQGIGGGLALSITTPIESLEKEALARAGSILLLAVPAGTSGSTFDLRVVDKITELRKKYEGVIIVDGGINKQTSQLVLQAGASEVAANSAYWRGEFGGNQI